MKAVVTTGEKRGIVVKDIPKPQVQPGTLLLKTIYCSICGGDLEYLDGKFEYVKMGELHAGAILGHEFYAEVAEIGEGVKEWSIGDRVAPDEKLIPCGQCYFCRHRLYRFCTMGGSPRTLPYDNIPGGYGNKSGAMTEYFIRSSTSVQKVPDSVSDEEAALVEPLFTGLGSVEAAGLRPEESAVVIGAGRIGLGAMLCAKAAGAAPIIVIDVVKSRLDKALEMGADAVLNANEVDVVSKVVKLTEAGSDAVLICVRDGKVLNQAVDMARNGGIIVIAGFMEPMEVNPSFWILKQIRFVAIMGGSINTSMRLIAHKQVNVKPLISEIMPLEEAQRAFDSMYSGENLAVLLKP